jgi:hypothetical protein
MNRKLKALGALLSAALMVGAIAVVSAPAETGGHFTTNIHHVSITGSQVEVNKLNDPSLGSVECEKAEFHTTIASPDTTVTQVTVEPTYGPHCTNGSRVVHVDMNGCNYVFTVNKKPATSDNTVHLVCPVGQSVTLTVTSSGTLACVIHLKPQTPKGGVTFTTGGSGETHDLLVDVTVSGIHITRTAQFFGGCLFAAETNEAATLTGTATMKGFDTAGNQTGITAT